MEHYTKQLAIANELLTIANNENNQVDIKRHTGTVDDYERMIKMAGG